jgi:Domain of unknown function (DUF1918)
LGVGRAPSGVWEGPAPVKTGVHVTAAELQLRETVMEATIGDQICIHGDTVGHENKTGEIIEVHGTRGEPPYLVRFADGRTRLLFPGPDAVIVPQQRRNQEG